jgi:hypothetical protein
MESNQGGTPQSIGGVQPRGRICCYAIYGISADSPLVEGNQGGSRFVLRSSMNQSLWWKATKGEFNYYLTILICCFKR